MKLYRHLAALSPEVLFLIFATLLGAACLVLLPPLAGSDEYFHFQRIATIAYGHVLNEEASVPWGIAELLKKTTEYLNQESLFPYSMQHWKEVSAIPLSAHESQVLQPNYFTVHNPVNYIPQALVMRLGAWAGLTPLTLLYIVRLSGLVASVSLTFCAIRILPYWRYSLCALALLPPLAFYRVCLGADSITVSVGLLYLACVFREITEVGTISNRALWRIVALGTWFSLCKFPYAATTLLVLAIPPYRFLSRGSRLKWLSLSILPGVIATLAWLQLSRRGIFIGLHYHTWGGDAFPDGQTSAILHDPLHYLGVVVRTVANPSFAPELLKAMLGDIGTMYQTALSYHLLMLTLLGCVLWMDRTAPLRHAAYNYTVRFWSVTSFVGLFLISLTAVYIHWTGLGLPTVIGYQGRYLYPGLPLLLALLPAHRKQNESQALYTVSVISLFSLLGLLLTVPLLLAHWKYPLLAL